MVCGLPVQCITHQGKLCPPATHCVTCHVAHLLIKYQAGRKKRKRIIDPIMGCPSSLWAAADWGWCTVLAGLVISYCLFVQMNALALKMTVLFLFPPIIQVGRPYIQEGDWAFESSLFCSRQFCRRIHGHKSEKRGKECGRRLHCKPQK